MKLSDNHWGTKQSHFVPSCLWNRLTTIEVLNIIYLSHRVYKDIWPPLRYQTVSRCHIVFVMLSKNNWCTKVSLCPTVFLKLSDNHLCTKQSHFVPSCLWSCLTTIEVINSLALSHHVCKVIWHHWGTKQSHFVPSCLWSCLTSIEVPNSLNLSDSVCDDIWPPMRY